MRYLLFAILLLLPIETLEARCGLFSRGHCAISCAPPSCHIVVCRPLLARLKARIHAKRHCATMCCPAPCPPPCCCVEPCHGHCPAPPDGPEPQPDPQPDRPGKPKPEKPKPISFSVLKK